MKISGPAPLDPENFIVWVANQPDDKAFKEVKRGAELARRHAISAAGFKPENHPATCSASWLIAGKVATHEAFRRDLGQYLPV